MADRFPERRGPLAAGLPADLPGFSLSLAPDAARLILRGPADKLAAPVATLGHTLPQRPMTVDHADGRALFWLGPDEWLLLGEGEDPARLAGQWSGALAGVAHALVDVSHRQIALVAQGARAAAALSVGCPLDLDLSAFPVGMATRTLFEKAEILLWRSGAQNFRLEVWRSFAPYVAEGLTLAARDAHVV